MADSERRLELNLRGDLNEDEQAALRANSDQLRAEALAAIRNSRSFFLATHEHKQGDNWEFVAVSHLSGRGDVLRGFIIEGIVAMIESFATTVEIPRGAAAAHLFQSVMAEVLLKDIPE